jgi:hypothetical protein
MQNWQTSVNLKTGQNNIKTNHIKIKPGIFQSDRFGVLWFCLALNLLSKALNAYGYGYQIKSPTIENPHHMPSALHG